MSDGTSLNEKLAAMMPVAVGEERSLKDSVLVTSGDYAFTITPSSELYAFGSDISAGQKGEAVTQNLNVSTGRFAYGFGAAETDDIEDPGTTAYIKIEIGGGGPK